MQNPINFIWENAFENDFSDFVGWCLPLNLRAHNRIRSTSSMAKHVLPPVDIAVVMSITMSGKVMLMPGRSTGKVK